MDFVDEKKGEAKEEYYEHVQGLRESGENILEAIKSVRRKFGVSLSEAKRVVSLHPAYSADAKASDELHEELIEHFGE